MTPIEHTVTAADTALAVGSGDVPVLGTPVLLAWMENAAYQAAAEDIEPTQTTVGTQCTIEHSKAVCVGQVVRVKSEKPVNTGHRLLLHVKAVNAEGEIIGRAEIQRAVVEKERFLAKAHVQL